MCVREGPAFSGGGRGCAPGGRSRRRARTAGMRAAVCASIARRGRRRRSHRTAQRRDSRDRRPHRSCRGGRRGNLDRRFQDGNAAGRAAGVLCRAARALSRRHGQDPCRSHRARLHPVDRDPAVGRGCSHRARGGAGTPVNCRRAASNDAPCSPVSGRFLRSSLARRVRRRGPTVWRRSPSPLRPASTG